MDPVDVRLLGSEGEVFLDLNADFAEQFRLKQVSDDTMFVASRSVRRIDLNGRQKLLTAGKRHIAYDIRPIAAEALL